MEQYEGVRPIGPAWTVMGSNPVSAATLVPSQTGKYLIAPLGSNLCFLGYGPTSTAAQTNAQNMLIASGAVQNCLPVNWGPPSDAPRVFTLAPNQFFAGLTQTGSGTAPIVIIPCEGI